MAEQEHYSLRWNNHQHHILRAFDALLQTKSLVDVTLVCAETSIRAHKVVLSACSPFFQSVFSENPCKHPVIVLKDFHGWVVQAIVDFMYRGEISVPQERLQILIQAGESLEVRGLVDHPISDNVPTPAESLDDFIDTLGSPNSPHSMHYDDVPTLTHQSTVSGNCVSKPSPLIRSHMFIDGERAAHHQLDNRENCISPLPRRKQARPRRRSGECGPHDLTSRPASPLPSTSPTTATNFCTLDRHEKNNVTDSNNQRIPNDSTINRNPINSATISGLAQESNVMTEEDDEDDDGDRMDLGTDNDDNNDDNNDNEHDDNDDSDHEDNEKLIDNDSGDGPENLCIKSSINNNSETISNNNNSSNKNSNNDDLTTPTSSNNHNNKRIGLSLKDIRHLNRPPMQCRQNPFSPSGPHIDNRGISPGIDLQKSQSQSNQHLSSPMSNLAFSPTSAGLRKLANEKDIDNFTGSNSTNKEMNKVIIYYISV